MNVISRRPLLFAGVKRIEALWGADLIAWQSDLAKHWSSLRFGSATVQRQNAQYLFQVQVFFNDLSSEAIRVELYAESGKGAGPVTLTMNGGEQLMGAENGFTYSALVPASRPAADYTPPLVPRHEGAFVPLEVPFILWHDTPSWR